MVLADLPLKTFLEEQLIPYDIDEVTRLIIDKHNADAFNRDSLLSLPPINPFCHGIFHLSIIFLIVYTKYSFVGNPFLMFLFNEFFYTILSNKI
jgi:hypothetical protein